MRPLPRLHAITDQGVLAAEDLGIKAAAIAAAGPAVAIHVRAPGAGGAAIARAALRLRTLAQPPEAALFINDRADVAAAVEAAGLQLSGSALPPVDARVVFARGWIGRSVHDVFEAERAIAEGADFLLVGNIYPSVSHPGRPAAGLGLVREAAALGKPVVAIGGLDAARAWEVREAGAYGVAAISALWAATDPFAASLALLEPWSSAA